MDQSTATGTEDSSPTSLSVAVVEAVAEREDVDPLELERPLYDVIDTDALEELFAVNGDGRPRCDGHVTFVYGTHLVRVASDRSIQVLDAGSADGRDTGVEGA